MSDLSDELIEDVKATVETAWSSRDGKVVPESDDLKLGNDRVEMEAVFLYADLADSTELALKNREIASELCKAYLSGVTKIVRTNGGEIRSFDGDRVMAVFIEGNKHTAAVKSGLQINWFFTNAVRAKFKSFYSIRLKDFSLTQTVGIDRSKVYICRAGIRDNNDLIWVGRAPNIAAKLSGVRFGYSTLITERVYSSMLDDAKFGGSPRENMWTTVDIPSLSDYEVGTLYGSTWTWVP